MGAPLTTIKFEVLQIFCFKHFARNISFFFFIHVGNGKQYKEKKNNAYLTFHHGMPQFNTTTNAYKVSQKQLLKNHGTRTQTEITTKRWWIEKKKENERENEMRNRKLSRII